MNFKRFNKFRRGIVLFSILSLIFSMGCGSLTQDAAKSPYEQRKIDDANNTSPTYDRLVAGIGLENTEALIEGIGADQLDLLAYGAGTSNLILLVNIITDMQKLIDMVGSEGDPVVPGDETGLGAARVVKLLDRVDYWMRQIKYNGAVPDVEGTDGQDTIGRLAAFINGVTVGEITTQVVDLVDAMGVDRDLQGANDEAEIDRLAKLIAQVTEGGKIINMLSVNIGSETLTALEVTTKMKDLLLGLTVAQMDALVEVMDYITDADDMVLLIRGVNDMADIVAIMAAMNPNCASKLAYIIDNVTDLNMLTYMMNNIVNVSRMGDIINEMEDNTTWIGQIGGAQDWIGAGNTPSGADSGVIRLVALMNGLDTAPNPAKLVSILDEVVDMTKMMQIIQDVEVNQDMIDLISGFTLVADAQKLGYVIENTSLLSIPNMRYLVDGQRAIAIPAPANQPAYIGKLIVLITALDNGALFQGPLKIAQIVDEVTNIDNLIELVYDVSDPVGLQNLANIVNGINPNTDPSPDENSVHTMAYLVENIGTGQKLVDLIDGVTVTQNIVDLVDNVASNHLIDGSLDAAGLKLVAVIDGTTNVDPDLVFVMNNVANAGAMAIIVNNLAVANAHKMADLINGITGVNLWAAGTPDTATGQGKVVNMIDNITDLIAVARMVDEIVIAQKLYDFINEVAGTHASSNIVSLVNAVLADANGVGVVVDNMIDMMNGIAVLDIPKLSDLVTSIDGTEDQLIADLLAPISLMAGGIGSDNMVILMTELSALDTTPADGLIDASVDLATVMTGIGVGVGNAFMRYQGTIDTVEIREGMVRLINPTTTTGGVTYLATDFPGLGPVHLAVMMNSADNPNDLVTLLNSLGLDQMAPMIGCADHVNDEDGNHIPDDTEGSYTGPYISGDGPDFYTPCSALGMGW